MIRHILLLFALLNLPVFGQQFLLKGRANQLGPVTYELTKDTNDITGMITNQYPLDLTKNFSLSFEINLGTDDNGADGIAFLLSRSCNPTLTPGSGLGVSGTSNSIIVEFDTYDNGNFFPDNDIPDDHLGIYSDGILSSSNNITDGTTTPVCMTNPCQNMEDGNWYTVNIQWTFISATSQKIEIFINGSLRATSTGNHITNRFLGQSTVFYSIAASTGGSKNQQQVRFPSNNNPTYCGGQPFTLYAPKLGTNYQWSNGNTSTVDSATYNVNTTQVITCNYTDFCGQSRTINFTINVTSGIYNASPSQKICLHSTPNQISVSTTGTNSTDSLKFVYFKTKQINSAMYTGGTLITNVFPIANPTSYTLPVLGNIGSLPDSAGTYYVYAIIDPAPINNFCRPSQEIVFIIDSPKTTTVPSTICSGDSIGKHKTSGTYLDTLKSASGCDSIRTLILTVNPKTYDTLKRTICQGDSMLGRKTQGFYNDTLHGINKYGCDSIQSLDLTVNPKTTSFFQITKCFGDSFMNYKATGVYLDTLFKANSKGCDSIRKIDLTIITPKHAHSVQVNECQPYTYKGKTYSSSTRFLDTIRTSSGCDSLIDTIDIHIINATQNPAIKRQGCDSVVYNNQTYTSSNSFNDVIKSLLNPSCDSIVTPIEIIVYQGPSVSILTTPQPPFSKNEKIALTVVGKGQFLWNIGDTSRSINVVLTTNTTYTVIITDSNQCSNQASILLKVEDGEVTIPNAFSPNGDQTNETFYPVFDPPIEIVSMSIFNRWGEKLYEGKGNSVSWDGKFKGELQPVGVYLYFLEYKNNSILKTLKGTLSLVK